ncbi:hypothetical protein FJY68_08215 [candidate division WOR-3 bacterium]|uniref:Uncharacterized protein n=1 Tax=candidate division WOR-3 bacterium TaxID=2052148 RepID=A0A937XEA1_UNCW3|nr:hypothetical protein [candidate division WOR-3 bacterium]
MKYLCRIVVLSVVLACLAGCRKSWPFLENRYSKIPADAVKGSPATDLFPPILVSPDFEAPVPMPGPVNSAGAEDSPFITSDGQEFYFFFTPDVRVPVEKQLIDSVTGIWACRLVGGNWTEPERVVLSDDVSLDGCQQVIGDTLWFASTRSRNMLGDIDVFYAVRRNGEWADWRNAGKQLNVDYNIGEFHLTSDHQTLYFGSPEGTSDYDIWRMQRNATGWDAPVKLGPNVNTAKNEGWPYLSSDMTELYFTGWNDSFAGPCIYLSRLDSLGQWGPREVIVQQFAGEPTLDDAGNLYFVHHYYTGGQNNRMLEADIYVCRRK